MQNNWQVDSERTLQQQQQNQHADDIQVDKLIQDPVKRAELIQRVGFVNPLSPLLLTPSGMCVGDGTTGLTLSGTSVGSRGISLLWLVGPPFTPWAFFSGWKPQNTVSTSTTTLVVSKGASPVAQEASHSQKTAAEGNELVIQLCD